ncbi:MAG: hypothetical protein DRN81_01360 [Thermoproteota archaeon]|nr:MAG: hypothetical protein DRN81_01360 [Candidatus Korarchaeota archaeon]
MDKIADDEITTGTEQVFDEIRNLPCPHLRELSKLDTLCDLTRFKCTQHSVGECPIIQVLLHYIPWKREMLLEAQDEDMMDRYGPYGMYNQGDGYPGQYEDDEDLVVSRNFPGSNSNNIKIIGNTRLYKDDYYKFDINGVGEIVGQFIEFRDNDEIIIIRVSPDVKNVISVLNIDGMEPLKTDEITDYYLDGIDIGGIKLERDGMYEFISNNGKPYVGKIVKADMYQISVSDGNNTLHVLYESIYSIEKI